LVDPETRCVHVTPFGDVRIVPAEPVATNWVPDHVTASMFTVTPEARSVHTRPSAMS